MTNIFAWQELSLQNAIYVLSMANMDNENHQYIILHLIKNPAITYPHSV